MKQLTILIIITLYIITVLSSCSVAPEIADIKLDHSGPRLVVEGVITDAPGPYFVKLSLTGSYYEKTIVRVNDAIVTITDSEGNKDILTRTDEGIYQTNTLKGVVGNTYHIAIEYDGKTYTASSFLSSGITIDSIKTVFQKKTIVMDEGYYLTLYGKEPEGDNYYRWFISENDTLDKDIIISDDLFFSREIKALMIERVFQKGDKAKIEVQSISKEDYSYYIGLGNIIDNDGGFFSSPPKNPVGNISNGAMGIFRASKVSSAEILIE